MDDKKAVRDFIMRTLDEGAQELCMGITGSTSWVVARVDTTVLYVQGLSDVKLNTYPTAEQASDQYYELADIKMGAVE